MKCLAKVENILLITALFVLMLIPLSETIFRIFGIGISGAQPIVQHITLAIAMMGGAVAARESRLLSLSSFTVFLKPSVRIWTRWFAGTFSTFITVILAIAAFDFLKNEKLGGEILAYSIPKWWVQTLMPICFVLIGIRIWWKSVDRKLFSVGRESSCWWNKWGKEIALRLLGLVGLFVLLFIFYKTPFDTTKCFWPFLAFIITATLLGAPLFVTLSGVAIMFFWTEGATVEALPVDQYGLVTNPTLPTLPLFTLAGYFLAEGGASKRLIAVFSSLVGHIRGGTVIMTFLVCAFFTTFTGASGVTILALGGLLLPVLISTGYKEKSSLGIITGAGSLGLLFPPSLPLILYAIIAGNVSIQQMFLGGLLPGILMLALMGGTAILLGPKKASNLEPFSFKKAFRALWLAKWELAIPIVAVGALFSGYFTPVESASLTAVYAFFVETFIYRDLKFTENLSHTMCECGLLIGGVLLILGLALGLTNYLVFAEVPTMAVEWVTNHISSPLLFLLFLNVFLLIIGCLMDIYSAIVVVVPLIIPLGEAFGINPVHLGIVFLINLELGFLTPPVGMNLFLSSYRFGKPMATIMKAVIPMLLASAASVLLTTYIPWLTTFLPSLTTK